MSRLLVTNKSFELLEPYEGKLSRTVLRGESSRKGADLLDIFGDLIQYESGEMAIFSKKLSQYGCEATEMFNRSKVETTTVGQFTGLLDKKGMEIYEGDILHTVTFGFEPEEYTAIILYDNCRFQLSNGRNLFYFGQSDLTRMDDTIVIGNIYDNPELIIP